MKISKISLILVSLLGTIVIAKAQNPNEWRMILNNDHSAFEIKIEKNEMTFFFNPAYDTISFGQGNKKGISPGSIIEIILRNNNKVVYTSGDKNFNNNKTEIIIPMADVYNSLKKIKFPSRPKFMIAIRDKKAVKESIFFEFTEKN